MAKVTAMPSYRAEEDHLGYWIDEYMEFLKQDGAGELQKTRRMLMRFVDYMKQRTAMSPTSEISILSCKA
ncbi:hypothetical protein [Cohnella zeiphila]|uniref:Uncharacterized protein n=1 Tax=Cohnella zeiphila TaxID=2761120 RepID=A0A7X0VYU7_9BACL|nr:hypothetical protein [Cohnella zeiphila]MBB6735085.1 hypothetical protein [Cohnella zeiphila]